VSKINQASVPGHLRLCRAASQPDHVGYAAAEMSYPAAMQQEWTR